MLPTINSPGLSFFRDNLLWDEWYELYKRKLGGIWTSYIVMQD